MIGSLGAWAAARQPASWRGIPFAVRDSELRRGRRTAVHEYVMRDVVWVEDLGRATQVTSFRGFVVGDDADAQMQALADAAEQAGPGTLVHPVLGTLTASLLEFSARDSAEQGRVWALEFVFITSSERQQPGSEDDTQGDVDDAADAEDDAGQSDFADFVDGVRSGIADAADVVHGVTDAVHQVGAVVQGVVSDVTTLGNAVTGLAGVAGNFGRFSLGARLGPLSAGLGAVNGAIGTVNGVFGTVDHALALSNAAVASVGRLANGATYLAEQL